MKKSTYLLNAFIVLSVFGFASPVFAQMELGAGPGCSALGGMTATDLSEGDWFQGRIGTTGVSGYNRNGKLADDSDGDGLTDSLEECINDSLIGHCTTILGDDSTAIELVPGTISGKNGNKQEFTVRFLDTSGCAVTQCSDQIDNDGDGDGIDYPNDPDCDDYDDDSESANGEGSD